MKYGKQLRFGATHNHTEASIKDSAMSASRLVQIAKDMNAPALCLTDHGTLLGVYEFMGACKEAGINGIPGVEAYVQEDALISKRSHLILLPKDYQGYQAISKAVTESNDRFKNGFPCMNLSMLTKHFGKGASGHGHVIATSACMQGVLSTILLQNTTVEAEIAKQETKLSRCENPNDPAYQTNKEALEEAGTSIKEMIAKREVLTKLAGRKFGQKEKALRTLQTKGPEADYLAMKERIEQEKAETEKAAEDLSKLKAEIAKSKKRETLLRQKTRDAEKTHETYRVIEATIKDLKRNIKDMTELKKDAAAQAMVYAELFGEGNFFIELQYHHIPDEATIMPVLAQIATELNLPLVAANDAHTPDNSDHAVRARRIVNSLRFNRWEGERIGDDELYVRSDEELAGALIEILPENIVDQAMEGIGKITSSCHVEMPHESHFPRYLDENGKPCDTKALIRALAEKNIPVKYPGDAWTEELQKRLEYELDIIDKCGYNDYLCIVEDFLRYGRKLGLDNPEHVGLGIGSGRGSAVGSLVCYLSGITGVDPIRYNLIFERFLNTERVSSPDIDSDFAIDKRDAVLQYVKDKYGEDGVCNIVTKGTLAAKASIKAAARLLGDAVSGDTRTFLSLGDEIANVIPARPDIKLSDCEAELSAFETNENARQIIADARLVEGVTIQYGMHAAGVIIADNGCVSDYVPLMRAKEGEPLMCQCDMVQSEMDAGLLKFDFLGLRNLNIITDTLRTIKRHHGVEIDIEKVGRALDDGRTTPFDHEEVGNVFDEIFAKARTNSVFQFESSGMKSMLKRFKPSCMDDIILLVACYRPGPMQYLNDIIEVKHGRKTPDYVVPQMAAILDSTYGYPVFQEQIMEIFHSIAGFSLGEADIIRRYMAKKKAEKFAVYKEKFIDGLIASGATKERAEDFWTQLLEFAKYAFNKSHSAAYAMVSFYTAWLKLNYPAEYMTAVLNYTPAAKLAAMVTECKDMGVSVLPPDINRSEESFSYHDGMILFGLGSIKNVGKAVQNIMEERSKNKFHSFKDYVMRGHTKKDVTESLIDAGALDCWCDNRAAMKMILDSLSKDAKRILEKEAALETETDPKKKTQLETKLKLYTDRFRQTVLPIDVPESMQERLEAEKELLGMYVSGHPLDGYQTDGKSSYVFEVEEGDALLCGTVCDLRIVARKSDGAKMAFFTLEDKTGGIEVCVFAKTFRRYGDLLTENKAIAIDGVCKAEGDVDGEATYKLIANAISLLEKKREAVLVSVPDLGYYTDHVVEALNEYEGDDYDVLIYDEMLSEIRKSTFMVKGDILQAKIDRCSVSVWNA